MNDQPKQQLRTRLKQERALSDPVDLSRQDIRIAQAVLALPEFSAASLVLSYLSFGNEVDTRALVHAAWEEGKKVALPKCQPKGLMSWHLVTSFDDLVVSQFGIEEPTEELHPVIDLSDMSEKTVALVPGLAFDLKGYRIGYGGGFYDRFLKEFPGVSIGLCRSQNLFDSLTELSVLDAHDKPVDIVISDN